MMTPFKIESWIWYGFAISMVLLRLLARGLHFKSITRLQIEDWLMCFIACLYTIFMVFINIAAVSSSNLIDPSDIPNLTDQDIRDRIFGSKAILVVEQCMCAVQWGTKACLLILYWRLTQNLVDTIMIKGTAIYVGLTYIVMEVLYFGYWCRPFHDYWETPTDNIQCTTALHHLILNLAFNLTSDLLIMSIPLPLVLRAHLELKRKILLILPFTLGFFSIVCAILSKHLSFTQPFSSYWVYWYTREASTVMIVSNMPYTWGLVRRVFNVHSFFDSRGDRSPHASAGEGHAWSGGMEMYSGHPREIHGLSIPASNTNTLAVPAAQDLTRSVSKRSRRSSMFTLKSWKPSSPRGMERLPSANPTRDGEPKVSLGVDAAQEQWNHHHGDPKDVAFGVDIASSGTSSAATSDGRPSLAYHSTNTRNASYRSNADAIDRLYRLDDNDLMADLEKQRKRSDARDLG